MQTSCKRCAYASWDEWGDMTCGYGSSCFLLEADRILEEIEYGVRKRKREAYEATEYGWSREESDI